MPHVTGRSSELEPSSGATAEEVERFARTPKMHRGLRMPKVAAATVSPCGRRAIARSASTVGALVLSVFLLACDGGEERLNGDAVTQQAAILSARDLDGRTLLRQDRNEIEIFGCEGAWRLQGQSNQAGAYEVNGAEVCVTPNGAESFCRSIEAEDDSVIVLTDARSGQSARYFSMTAGGLGSCSPVRLNTQSIRDAVAGTSTGSLTRREGVHDAASRWEFDCDGAWRALGGQVDITGRYEISNDELCMDSGAGRACVAVYRAPDDSIYVSARANSQREPGEPITQLRLERHQPACF